MLLVWNCLQINRLNTATLTVVGTHLYFASDRIPYVPNDRLLAPTFEVVAGDEIQIPGPGKPFTIPETQFPDGEPLPHI